MEGFEEVYGEERVTLYYLTKNKSKMKRIITLLLVCTLFAAPQVFSQDIIPAVNISSVTKHTVSREDVKIFASAHKAYMKARSAETKETMIKTYERLVRIAGSKENLREVILKYTTPTCEQQCAKTRDACREYCCEIHGCCQGCTEWENCQIIYMGCLAGCAS
jgi:hypothetical protein